MKVLLVLLLLLPFATAGQPAAADERSALASRLVQVMQLDRAMQASMDASQEAVGGNLLESMVRSNPSFGRLNEQQRAKLTAGMGLMLKRLYGQMREEIGKKMNLGAEISKVLAPVYAEYFSLDEMRKLIEFYESPVGRKIAASASALQPEITKRMQQDLLPRMMAAIEGVVRESQPAMAQEMERLMEELTKGQ